MKNKIFILLFFTLNIIGGPVKRGPNKSAPNNSQKSDSDSLIAQKLYYLFQVFSEGFKGNKQNLAPVITALKQIDAEIKKNDTGSIANSLQEIATKLSSFKDKRKLSKQKTLVEVFDYLKSVYATYYKALKDKKITFGPDKNKMLVAPNNLGLPSETDINNFIIRKAKKGKLIPFKQGGKK